MPLVVQVAGPGEKRYSRVTARSFSGANEGVPVARPFHRSELDAVCHLVAPRAWSTTSGSEQSVDATRGPTPSRLVNVDHSVLR